MKYFLLSDPLGKGIRVVLLLVMLVLNFGPGGASVAYAAPPIHDDFNSAKVINAIEYHDLNVNTQDATPSDTIPNVDDPAQFPCQNKTLNYGFASVWYKYTPPEQQSLSLNTFGTTPPSYDTFIAVWTGTRGNLNLVACNDEIFENDDAEVSFVANAGTTYYIEVAQYNGPGDEHFIGGTLNFNAYITNTNVYVGDSFVARYYVPDGGSLRKRFINLNNGPVQVINLASNQIIAAERVIYNVNNVNTSFTEMMGLPNSQLDAIYWLPWYNNVDLDTQLRFGNVSGTTATVRLYIGGIERSGCTSTPAMAYPYVLANGQSLRVRCTGLNSGPVKIASTQDIVAAERVIYKINGVNTSFSEMMALPNSQLDTTYWFPWYNNVSLDTQFRFGNVSGTTATVRLYIGGIERSGCTSTPAMAYPYVLANGQSVRVRCTGLDSGPVKIESTQDIVAAERVIYKINGVNTSFSEMMGLPNTFLDVSYWMPWYNNVDLDTQLRFGMP